MKTMEHVHVDIGVREESLQKISEGLCKVLADTYTLYLKTQNFHWNVTGPQFKALHEMFEEQYRDLAEAADLIAERIRALGYVVPATYGEFSELTSLRDEPGHIPADQMIRSLMEGNEAVTRGAHQVFKKADEADDQATADMLTERMERHEKVAWMLRRLLSEKLGTCPR